MKHTQNPFPLVKLPEDVQFSLYLIKEELKSRKLFHVLHLVGLDDCSFQPHLDSLILRSVGMDDDSDETFTLYDGIVEKRSKKIDSDNDSNNSTDIDISEPDTNSTVGSTPATEPIEDTISEYCLSYKNFNIYFGVINKIHIFFVKKIQYLLNYLFC